MFAGGVGGATLIDISIRYVVFFVDSGPPRAGFLLGMNMTDDNEMFSRSGTTNNFEKCTAEVKTHVPEELKEALAALATLNGKTLSEYAREVFVAHVYGHLAVVRSALRHKDR